MSDFYSKELELPRSIAVFSLPSIPELEEYLYNIVNDTVNTLNQNLHELGYKLQPFINLKHKNIEIINPVLNKSIYKIICWENFSYHMC